MGGKSQCILVIDDDQAVLEAIGAALGAAGYWVETARSGSEGLALAGRFAVALVLVDVEMPGIDGLAVRERLRLDPMLAHVSVVLLAERLTPRLQARAAEAGVAGLVEKPVVMARMLRVVERSLRPRP